MEDRLLLALVEILGEAGAKLRREVRHRASADAGRPVQPGWLEIRIAGEEL
jgi:hypothetical protein